VSYKIGLWGLEYDVVVTNRLAIFYPEYSGPVKTIYLKADNGVIYWSKFIDIHDSLQSCLNVSTYFLPLQTKIIFYPLQTKRPYLYVL